MLIPKQPSEENVKLFQEGKKKCCNCDEIKELNKFSKAKNRFNGYSSRCKQCDIVYREENKEKYSKTALEWRTPRRAERCLKEKQRRESIGADEFNAHRKELYKQNKEKHRLKRLESMKDPLFKIAKVLRDRLYQAIRMAKAHKYSHTEELLGCEFEEFKKYIESIWDNGMTWGNYGHGEDKWVLDHIVPCASFNLLDEEDQKKCFHYSNLQPLWFSVNASKSSYHNGVKHFYQKVTP
jgi:hypothetical protein